MVKWSVSQGSTGDSPFLGSATRVSIFLSPLDVHINRTPVDGKIAKIPYQRGKFLAAYKEEASERNEQNALSIIDSRGENLGSSADCRSHRRDELFVAQNRGISWLVVKDSD